LFPGQSLAMNGSEIAGIWVEGKESPGANGEKLDRALVAGLMLEVILETSGCPADPQARRRHVKARLKDAMATQLAGRVTLDRFRHLLRKVDHWFPLYYPLVTEDSPRVSPARRPGAGPAPGRALRDDLLHAWFQQQGGELLPRRPHRKLHPGKLQEFLQRTQGGWFRLKDFEQHFGMDRKTAWEYLQKLLQAGLLRHNRRRSAAVRYALATAFLRVRADLLEPRVAEVMSGLPQRLKDQVSQSLIASGGEAFGAEEWPGRLEALPSQEVTARLEAAGLLEVVSQAGPDRQLRLPRQWLHV